MANISINITANSGGSSTALDDLSRKIDASMQYAAQRMAASFDSAINRLSAGTTAWANAFIGHIARIEQSVDRMLMKISKLGGGAGAGGGGGGASPNYWNMMAGWDATGAYAQNFNKSGMTLRTQFLNPATGEMAWINDKGTNLSIRQGQTEVIAQRQAEQARINSLKAQAQMSDVMAMGDLNRFRFGQENMASGDAIRAQQARQYSGLQRFQGWIDRYGMNMTGSREAYDPRTGRMVLTENWSSGDTRGMWGRLLGRGYTSYEGDINRTTGGGSLKTVEHDAIGIGKAMMSAKDAVVTFAASIFSLQSVGNFLYKWLVQPFKDFVGLIFTATDEYRKFETSISGVAGGMGRARAIDQAVLMGARTSPMTVKQLHEAGVGLTFTQYGASRVSGGSSGAAANAIIDYATLLQQLSNLAPEQGVGGAQIAVREALAGNFQSARRRLNTSPELIAQSLRKPGGGTYTLAEITGNQALTMQAFQSFASTWIGNEPIEGQKNLFSNAYSKLGDAFTQMAAKIGNAGVYDKFVDRIRGITDALFKFMDSKEFEKAAKTISDGMVSIFDAITDSVLGFFQRFTGTHDIQSMLSSVSDIIANTVSVIGDLIGYLPTLTSWIGSAFGAIVDGVKELYAAAKNPMGAAITAAVDSTSSWIGGFLGNFGLAKSSAPASAPSTGSPFENMPRFQRSNSMYLPFVKERAWRDFLGSQVFAGNYRPLAMGMINTVANGAQTFQLTGSEGQTFEFPVSPFQRGLNVARSLPGALRDSLTVDGDTASYEQLLSKVRGDVSNLQAVQFAVNGMPRGFIKNVMPGNYNQMLNRFMQEAEGRRAAIESLPESLGYQFGNVAGSLTSQLSTVAPGGRSAMLQRIMYDADGLIPAIADELKLKPEERQRMHESFRKAVLEHPDLFIGAERDNKNAMISAYGSYGRYDTYGGYTRPTTPRDMMRWQQTSSADFGRKFAAAADTERRTNGETVLYHSLADSAAKELWNAQKLEHDLNDALKAVESFSERSRDAIEGGIGDALYGIITQTSSVSDAFRSMADSILKSFTGLTADLLMQGLFGADFLKQGKGEGGIGLGGLGGLFGGLFSFMGKSDGGIFPGSYMPMRAFSDGGVAHSTTIGLVAEAGRPEAIVPLPNGRSIPVEMRGGGGRVFVVNSKQEARAAGYNPSVDDLVSIVAEDIHKGGKAYRAMKAKVR